MFGIRRYAVVRTGGWGGNPYPHCRCNPVLPWGYRRMRNYATDGNEQKMLRDYAAALQQQLDRVNERINELTD